MVAQGEVWWSQGPDWGRRPVLALTRDAVAPRLTWVLTALVTSVVYDLPTEVALDEEDGMPRPCVVSLDNVATTHAGHLAERITRLGPERMHRRLPRAQPCHRVLSLGASAVYGELAGGRHDDRVAMAVLVSGEATTRLMAPGRSSG